MIKSSKITCLIKGKTVLYNDPGRFDVCQDCPLKKAIVARQVNKK